MRYDSSAQEPKSSVRQRAEQKGRWGFPCQGTGVRQVGHLTVRTISYVRKTPWSGRPGSNRRRPAWEAGILPLNYARSDQGRVASEMYGIGGGLSTRARFGSWDLRVVRFRARHAKKFGRRYF